MAVLEGCEYSLFRNSRTIFKDVFSRSFSNSHMILRLHKIYLRGRHLILNKLPVSPDQLDLPFSSESSMLTGILIMEDDWCQERKIFYLAATKLSGRRHVSKGHILC